MDKKILNQLEFKAKRPLEPDRNFNKGGRSFYFFDFDDNVAFLSTPTYLFHKNTGEELIITSREFTRNVEQIGRSGPYAHYKIDFDNETGSFRNFRDQDHSLVQRFFGKKQNFVKDLIEALGYPDFQWKGPSWSYFFHAVYNKRSISVITARGHHPKTLKKGIQVFITQGHIPYEPNYLALYPVNYPQIKNQLVGAKKASTAELKKAAIRRSVERAIEVYGPNPFHRFGMSDDDPRNIQMVTEEMVELKKKYKEMSFYIIDTSEGQMQKKEIY